MADDSVRRTDTVPLLGGFSGHHTEDLPHRRRVAEEEEERQASPGDEVSVRADTVAAMQLLRERVLACTRLCFKLGALHVPVFAEILTEETVEQIVSRLLSDQNHLAAHAPGGGAPARRAERFAAFEQGLDEARELLADAGAEVRAAIDRVEAEFARRLAALAADAG